MPVQVEVWGDYALFCRPEAKIERVSYDIMTPSAARGILDAIYWHPGMRYVIDRIHVKAPIQYISLRRNEISTVTSANNVLNVMNGMTPVDGLSVCPESIRQQRSSLMLRQVRYIIDAHIITTPDLAPGDNVNKFLDIVNKRIKSGRCYHQPYLGTRECTAQFRPYETPLDCPDTLRGEHDYGLMLYDMDYGADAIRPRFFHAITQDGVLHIPHAVKGAIR